MLGQLRKEADLLKDTFRIDCRNLVSQQHSRDLSDIDNGMIRQLEKHFDKWQTVFAEFQEAAQDTHDEALIKVKKHTAQFAEVLQKIQSTEIKKTSDMVDLEIAGRILESREQ